MHRHPKTFGSILASNKGLGPGFDFLRIALAFSIVFCHSLLLTGNDEFFRSTPLWFAEYALVPMFFALSGFLIAGSAQRLSLKNFLINRSLRIVPALGVDIVVCALIIGPLVTTYSLGAYFSHPDFARYFLNIIGWIHYRLPGVFETNPSYYVNGALWTVPWEILCYVVMSFLMLTSIINSSRGVSLLIALYFAAGIVFEYNPDLLPSYTLNMLASLFTVSRGSQLILAFLIGILFYQLRERLPHSRILLMLSIAICIAGMFTLTSESIFSVPNRAVLIPALVYITIYIGLIPMWLPSALKKGDYSYGVYLYHDPFLQVLISISAGLFLYPIFGALGLYAIGICATLFVAVFSWHLIEKPILGLRKQFSFVAKARGV